MSRPFIIYALPRSRTYWLSRFLSYGDYECSHDQIRHVRGPDDVKAWLSQDFVGTAETGAARWWRLVQHYRPDIQVVVVRRPLREVLDSLLRLDMRGVCTFEREVLARGLAKLDCCLDRIAQEVPGAISVSFSGLNTEAVCANVFEHCLPYDHDPDWWGHLSRINMQANMPALMRYCFANKKQLKKAGEACCRQVKSLAQRESNREPVDLTCVTIQDEQFDGFWRDGQRLFAEHKAEVGGRDGVILNPNIPLVRNLADLGAMQILTARANGEMIGYLVSLISPSLEDAGLTTALQTIFFVSKKYRGIGPRLERSSIEMLRSRGVGEVVMRAGVRGSGPKLKALYERLGAEDYGQLYTLMLRAA